MTRTTRAATFDLACAFVALVVAVLVYRGWRPTGGLWLNVPSTPFDAALLAFARAHPLPDWTRYSLPDALWQYAFGATMCAVWRGAPWKLQKALFILSPAAFGIFVELGQLVRIIPGTFDVIDLVASFVAAGAALLVHGEVVSRQAGHARRPGVTEP